MLKADRGEEKEIPSLFEIEEKIKYIEERIKQLLRKLEKIEFDQKTRDYVGPY